MKILPRLGLLFLLLLFTPLRSQAQPPDYRNYKPPKVAWLNVRLDPWGPATVHLSVLGKVENREELERSLLKVFNFPMELTRQPKSAGETLNPFSYLVDQYMAKHGISNPWTTIDAENARPFRGLRIEGVIDPEPLIAPLQSQDVETLNIWVEVGNPTYNEIVFKNTAEPGAEPGSNHLEMEIDLRAPQYNLIAFEHGYSVRDIPKRSTPMAVFLLVPMLLTLGMSLSARKLYDRPAELWARHLRFSNRLMGAIWPVWLCVYSLCGLSSIFLFVLGPGALFQFVNIGFYFVPPVIAMVLCHLASRGVYRHVTGVPWSPSEVFRRAMLVNAASLAPLFVLVLVLHSLETSPRQAALYAVVGYFGWLFLNQAFSRAFGPRLHALTSGDLRDRIFDLAQSAGVVLKQVYVLPEERAQLSNAFARSDNSVMITTSLLKNLTRREVNAIMAHEIGHLQAKHPQTSRTVMITTIVIVQVVGTVFATMIGFANALPFVFAVSIVCASLVLFFISRRNERHADAVGIRLTGDPEGFICGLSKLSRLNLMPLHAGGWGESLETHPNTMRRLQGVATTYGISNDRFQELISDSFALPGTMYPAIAEEEAESVIFSSEFRKQYGVRSSLAMLGTIMLVPLPFAAVLGHESVSGVLLLGIGLAGLLASFGVYQVVRNVIVCWGNGSLASALRTRLEKRGLSEIAQGGIVVGLAPAGDPQRYENYPFWDIGLLWLTNEKLHYFGEQIEFALAPGQVQDVYVELANPEWLPDKNLFVQWQNGASGMAETLHFNVLDGRSILKTRRAVESLKERLEAWRSQPQGFPAAPAEIRSIGAPSFPGITSVPAVKVFKPTVFSVAFQFAFYGAVIAFAFGLSWLSVFYLANVVFLVTVADELPKAFRPKVSRVEQRFEGTEYRPGSWAETKSATTQGVE